VTARARAILCGALSIIVVGCGDGNEPSRTKCGIGRGGVSGLPGPTPVWTRASSQSIFYAPRVVDLDGDGNLEVLLAGGNETPAFGEVMALDGKTGAVRWLATADAELYSSPVFLDVTGDGVKDVFVGGRMAAFIAVDGASGAVLWRFQDDRATPDGFLYSFYNFYTPVLISDQTGDGLPDLLVANGGGDGIRPGEPRPPGHLAVLSSADGSIAAYAVMPDGQETYMSAIVLPDAGTASPTILFGTGGETWAGALWEAPLSAVMAGDLSGARALVTGAGKGMIAPPALADVDRDGRLDIIVATFDGRLIVLSGSTRTVIWQRTFEDAESYTTPALGFFDADDVPDVFAVFLHGTFPDYISAERVLLSGGDGDMLWQGETGDFAMAGDVAIDLDGDGIDEVIFNANTLRDPLTGRPADQQLHVIDTARHQARAWGMPLGALAAGSPWVGDLDADGCLDLLMPRHLSEPGISDGLLTRFRVAASVPATISWGGYFGTRFDSVVVERR
jgi:outer membrane protein assembly factor BamB